MSSENHRSYRMMRKRFYMLAIALICMPLNAGCDMAKAMAAIGQLVSAIAPNTGASGASGAPAAPGTAAAPGTTTTPKADVFGRPLTR